MKNTILRGICSLLAAVMLMTVPVHAQEEEVPEQSEKSGQDDDQGGETTHQITELGNIAIELTDGSAYTYTGVEVTPTVEKAVYENVDGIIEETTAVMVVGYQNNIEIGSADIIISIEGYEGTATIEDVFDIVFGSVTSMKATPVTYEKTKLTWDKVAGADGYRIYRSTKSTSGFKTIKTIGSGETNSYNDTTVTMGTIYYYKMRAYQIVDGEKVFSDYTNEIKQKAQVATAKITSAKRASYKSITVEWGKVSGASGYGIYRSTSEQGTYERIGTVKGGSTLEYTDKNCSCGVTYYYKVAAYRTSNKKNYYGSKSIAVSAKTTPTKIAFTSSTMSGDTHATLYWKKSSGATGYTIYRSTERDFGYKAIKHITKATTLKWKNVGLEADQVYYYKVRPFVQIGDVKVYCGASSAYKKELFSVKIKNIQKYTYVQYKSGGTSTSGWDCSGFTQWALKYLHGVNIEKYSGDQATGGKAVSKTNRSKWKPGDILVYSSGGRVNHVALYIGDNRIMHALNKKYDTVIQDVDYYEKWDKKNNLKYVRRFF